MTEALFHKKKGRRESEMDGGENMDNEQKEEVFNILISLVRIYGDPKLIKRDKNDY